MPQVTRTWKISGRKPLNPNVIAKTSQQYGWPMSWYGKVNGLSCPRGRDVGEAHFLVSEADLNLIGEGPVDVSCEHEGGTTTWTGYYRIKAEAVTKQGSPAYWLTLGDRRFLLERSSAGNARYNLRKSPTEYVEETTNSGTPYTWQEIFEDQWGRLPGAAGAAPSISGSGTPENLAFDGMSAWRAVNQIATAVGHAIVLNPFTGTFTAVGLASDTSRQAVVDRTLWTFNPATAEFALPQTAKVLFPVLPGEDSAIPYQPWHQPPFVHDGSIGGPSGAHSIIDTLMGYDDNASDRIARATAIGQALAGLLDPLANPWGEIYAGVVELQLHSRLTNVRWLSDGSRGMRTIAEYCGAEIDWPSLPEYDAAGSGGGESIWGTLSSLTTSTDPGFVGIQKGSVAVVLAPVGQEDLLGTSVDVYDHTECIFDLPFADLDGVWVNATKYIKSDGSGGATDPFWGADDRCCVDADGA